MVGDDWLDGVGLWLVVGVVVFFLGGSLPGCVVRKVGKNRQKNGPKIRPALLRKLCALRVGKP